MRNPIGVRLIRIHGKVDGANLSRIQYYCQFCWDTIIERAKETYPQLVETTKTKDDKAAYAQQMGVLLGYRENPVGYANRHGVPMNALDREYKLSDKCVKLGVPLTEFHPTGTELEEHIEEAHRILTPVGWE